MNPSLQNQGASPSPSNSAFQAYEKEVRSQFSATQTRLQEVLRQTQSILTLLQGESSLARHFHVPLASDTIAGKVGNLFGELRLLKDETGEIDNDIRWIDVLLAPTYDPIYDNDGYYYLRLNERKGLIQLSPNDHNLIITGLPRKLVQPCSHPGDVLAEKEVIELVEEELSSLNAIASRILETNRSSLARTAQRLEALGRLSNSISTKAVSNDLTETEAQASVQSQPHTKSSESITREATKAGTSSSTARPWTSDELRRLPEWYKRHKHKSDMEIQDQFLDDFGTARSPSAIRAAFYRSSKTGKSYRASRKRNLRGKRSFRRSSIGQEAATAGSSTVPSASVSDAGVSVAEVPFLKAFKMDIPAIAGETSSSESVQAPQTQDRSRRNPPNMVTKTQPESDASEVGLSNPHQTHNLVLHPTTSESARPSTTLQNQRQEDHMDYIILAGDNRDAEAIGSDRFACNTDRVSGCPPVSLQPRNRSSIAAALPQTIVTSPPTTNGDMPSIAEQRPDPRGDKIQRGHETGNSVDRLPLTSNNDSLSIPALFAGGHTTTFSIQCGQEQRPASGPETAYRKDSAAPDLQAGISDSLQSQTGSSRHSADNSQSVDHLTTTQEVGSSDVRLASAAQNERVTQEPGFRPASGTNTPAFCHIAPRPVGPMGPQATVRQKPNKGRKKPRNQKALTGPKHACITCSNRNVNCDEQRPTCNTCAHSGVQCRGYSSEAAFQMPPSQPLNNGASSFNDRHRMDATHGLLDNSLDRVIKPLSVHRNQPPNMQSDGNSSTVAPQLVAPNEGWTHKPPNPFAVQARPLAKTYAPSSTGTITIPPISHLTSNMHLSHRDQQ